MTLRSAKNRLRPFRPERWHYFAGGSAVVLVCLIVGRNYFRPNTARQGIAPAENNEAAQSGDEPSQFFPPAFGTSPFQNSAIPQFQLPKMSAPPTAGLPAIQQPDLPPLPNPGEMPSGVGLPALAGLPTELPTLSIPSPPEMPAMPGGSPGEGPEMPALPGISQRLAMPTGLPIIPIGPGGPTGPDPEIMAKLPKQPDRPPRPTPPPLPMTPPAHIVEQMKDSLNKVREVLAPPSTTPAALAAPEKSAPQPEAKANVSAPAQPTTDIPAG